MFKRASNGRERASKPMAFKAAVAGPVSKRLESNWIACVLLCRLNGRSTLGGNISNGSKGEISGNVAMLGSNSGVTTWHLFFFTDDSVLSEVLEGSERRLLVSFLLLVHPSTFVILLQSIVRSIETDKSDAMEDKSVEDRDLFIMQQKKNRSRVLLLATLWHTVRYQYR